MEGRKKGNEEKRKDKKRERKKESEIKGEGIIDLSLVSTGI